MTPLEALKLLQHEFPWAKHIYLDKYGNWYISKNKPISGIDCWIRYDRYKLIVNPHIDYQGDWKDSRFTTERAAK